MAKKPSQRTHRIKPMEGLNLTPFIDMITCLMFFLLMFAGVIPVVIIDAPLPKIADTAEEVKQAKDNKNTLEVTIYLKPDAVQVKAEGAGEKTFSKQNDGKFPWDDVHKFLVQVHGHKPDSHEITLMPSDDTPYEEMIDAMDSSRELEKNDSGYQQLPPEIAAKPESMQFNRLFPDVSIGGV
jgi:biopolymer transport protein ExbD